MAEKRKDSRGIQLKTGESQLASGKYRYRYYDDVGRAHEVTAWTLRKEDHTPDGRKPGRSLRELEADIKKQLEQGVRAWDASITVAELCKRYMEEMKPYWAESTLMNYEAQYGTHIKDSVLGRKRISKVDADDIEKFFLSLNEEGMKVSSIGITSKLLNSSFKKAVNKKMISVNPVSGAYGSASRKIGEPKTQRHALEETEINSLLAFIRDNPKLNYYHPLFYFLAWTGCRIGEALGLKWSDVDFKNELIHIRRTMEYVKDKETGNFVNMEREPKTEAGKREIPMLKQMKPILQELRQQRKVQSIDGYVFIGSESKKAFAPHAIRGQLCRIVTMYNKAHEDQLTEISCHIFRHSFTCWLIENFSCGENASLLDNLKYIQKILGHSDASTTLNVYAELRKDKLREKHEILKQKAKEA